DRWPAFAAESIPGARILAHDMTLPMPFLKSGSFDGVLSHYAIDYVSPICARQMLCEARRLLAPGGLLLIYVAAIGLGGGDAARTVAYSPATLRAMLREAGFDAIEAEVSPNGRNTVARALRADGDPGSGPRAGLPQQVPIEGDTQLSAGLRGA